MHPPLHQTRLQRHRPPQYPDRLLKPAEIFQYLSHPQQRFRKLLLPRQRRLELRHRLVRLLQLRKRDAQMVMVIRRPGIDLHRPLQQFQRLIPSPRLQREQRQHLHRIRLIRIGLQNPPIERFRLGGLPRLMPLHRFIEQLLHRRITHRSRSSLSFNAPPPHLPISQLDIPRKFARSRQHRFSQPRPQTRAYPRHSPHIPR